MRCPVTSGDVLETQTARGGPPPVAVRPDPPLPVATKPYAYHAYAIYPAAMGRFCLAFGTGRCAGNGRWDRMPGWGCAAMFVPYVIRRVRKMSLSN